MGIFRCNRFVAQVQTKAMMPRLADDSRQDHGCGQEIHIGQFGSIPIIPEDTRPGTALDLRTLSVDGKSGSSSCDDFRLRQAGAVNLGAQIEYWPKRRFALFLPLFHDGIMDVAVIGVESFDLNRRHGGRATIEFERAGANGNARTVLAAINIKVEAHRKAGHFSGSRKRPHRTLLIKKRGKFCRGKTVNQLEVSANIRPDRLISKQDIQDAAGRGHFRFGDRGALEFADALPHLQAQKLRRLVGFNMRTEPFRPIGDSHHPAHVLLDAF